MTSVSDNLRAHTKELEQRTARLKAELKDLLKSLPPNPHARQVARNCCVVSSSAVLASGNWSPSYWINSGMVDRIGEIIDKTRPENLRKTIAHILRNGTYEERSGHHMHIHPAALKALRRAWLRGA